MNFKLKKIIILVSSIVLGIIAINNYTVDAFTKPQNLHQEIIVQKNDTLWSIAEKNTVPGQDVRITVYQIRKINNLSSAVLQPGQHILIPKPEGKV